jgi:hypothetical protein
MPKVPRQETCAAAFRVCRFRQGSIFVCAAFNGSLRLLRRSARTRSVFPRGRELDVWRGRPRPREGGRAIRTVPNSDSVLRVINLPVPGYAWSFLAASVLTALVGAVASVTRLSDVGVLLAPGMFGAALLFSGGIHSNSPAAYLVGFFGRSSFLSLGGVVGLEPG